MKIAVCRYAACWGEVLRSCVQQVRDRLACPIRVGADEEAGRGMSDNEDVQLPIPSRTTGVYASGVSSLRSGRGGTAGAGRSSRKVVEGLRTASSRRLNYSSFTSNGSNKGMNGENTDGSATGSIAGPGRGGGGGTQSKSCSACGIQFTWRMRRHHCRGCKKVGVTQCFACRRANRRL